MTVAWGLFLFKQRTAYDISACLVGSEMGIRDGENVGGVESRHLFTEHALEVAQEGYAECLKALSME